ncbi:MAG: Re/Si-specific NAD(P)(+) transhydrogenase subunit alpha [Porphyromonadaceae bacterium]|nr:MAG: Re/Si-specific NAD(P)(+) transhydrogenase subunit alpha [Porphyromonadaceae bacterium]
MIIGILKEKPYERRVSMQPASISSLIQKKKVRVLIEKSAGDAAFLPDKDYDGIADGIVDYEQLVEQSDLLVRISTPDDDLMGRMRSNQILVGVLNPLCNMPLVKKLLNHKITAFSMDMVPRTTRAQSMDVLSSMATVAGYKAVLDAAMHLPHFFPMFMTAAGTIAPAKVLVIGAGVAGLQAIATARKLGARVEAFDVRSAAKEEVESLGAKFVQVEGALENSQAGGYAIEQTEAFKKRQAQVIHEHAVKSDVVICSAQIPGKWAPRILKKETVQAMSPGSVIVDLAASSGGNCELTERYKNIVYNQVTIIGNTSYTSTLQADASKMFGHNVMNFLDLLIDDEGNLNLNFEDEVIRESCVSHNGEYVSKRIKEFYTEST